MISDNDPFSVGGEGVGEEERIRKSQSKGLNSVGTNRLGLCGQSVL